MENFFTNYHFQLIATAIVMLLLPIARFIVSKLVKGYAHISSIAKSRTRIIVKSLYFMISCTAIILFVIIWGVDPINIFITLSSIFAVIGVALFAQWSVLSNVTAGIILFFTVPFKIGDTIKIHDKDFPFEGTIEDIKAFHIHFRDSNGEFSIYPNNVLLQKGISIIEKQQN